MIIAMAFVQDKDIQSIVGLTLIDKHTHSHTYRRPSVSSSFTT